MEVGRKNADDAERESGEKRGESSAKIRVSERHDSALVITFTQE